MVSRFQLSEPYYLAKQLIVSAKNMLFIGVNVTPAWYKSKNVPQTCDICMSAFHDKKVPSRYTRTDCHMNADGTASMILWNRPCAFLNLNSILASLYSPWLEIGAFCCTLSSWSWHFCNYNFHFVWRIWMHCTMSRFILLFLVWGESCVQWQRLTSKNIRKNVVTHPSSLQILWECPCSFLPRYNSCSSNLINLRFQTDVHFSLRCRVHSVWFQYCLMQVWCVV